MGLTDRLIPILILVGIVVMISVGFMIMGASFRVYKVKSGQAVRHIADMPEDFWIRLTDVVIFFGHKSVGNNIIDGVRDLVDSHDYIILRIYETKVADRVNGAMFVHAPVGRNMEPESKIAEFKKIMEGGFGEKVDIAFFKFCFADIVSHSNPDAILAAYCETMEELKARFPEVIFVHVTVPLCAPPKTMKGILKVYIKRVLGRSTVLDNNLVRARYNDLLRERFSGKEPLFDLAEYEALGPDGLRYCILWKGHEVPILVNSYTDDGGHLNVLGRRHVAEQLLIKMLDLASSG